jgi:hypothetical protein
MWVILKVSGFKRIGSAEAVTSSLYKLFTAVDSAPSAISMFTWKFSEKLRNIPPRGLASILSSWLNGTYAIFSSPDVISKNLSFTRSIVSMSIYTTTGGLPVHFSGPRYRVHIRGCAGAVGGSFELARTQHFVLGYYRRVPSGHVGLWNAPPSMNRTIASYLVCRTEYRLASGHRNFLRGG